MIRESEVSQKPHSPNGVDAWGKRLASEVFRGPSANLRINPICAAAYGLGLVPEGDKFSFVREVAEIKHHAQPDGQPTRSLGELDLQQLAAEFNRPPDRVRTIAELMVQHGLLPKSET